MGNTWFDEKELEEYVVNHRRALHQIPELGYDLPKTSAYIRAELDRLGIPYRLNKGDDGLICDIVGGKPGKVIALRSDMDGLPIKEDTGLPFASTNGCMHACGHDTHMAMLLGAAKVLKEHQSELNGTVRLLWQTAEEPSRGAEVTVANGGVDGVDAVFGTHIGTIFGKEIPAGTLLVSPGSFMASFDKFVVKIKGSGCHGSTPEKGIDPVNIAAHIIMALQAVNAREFNACDPVVLTVCTVHGGNAYNVIPNEVVIEGTFRAVREDVRQRIGRRIQEISVATAQVFGGVAEPEIIWGAPPVVNDEDMATLAAEAAKEAIGAEHVMTKLAAPNMGGEDFAFYLQKVPGAFMFLSSSNPDKGTTVAHHNPKFDVDEDILWMGSAVFISIVKKFLDIKD